MIIIKINKFIIHINFYFYERYKMNWMFEKKKTVVSISFTNF